MAEPAQRESQSRYVLLGLLQSKPGTGYELRQRIEQSVGFFWNESWGQIYPTLKRLEQEKLIRGRLRPGQGKPDARVYSITKAGEQELQKWLILSPREEKPRNETLLKLMFTSRSNSDANREMIRKRLANYEHRLRVFTLLEQQIVEDNPGHPQLIFWRMTVRYGQKKAAAEIAWCTECLQMMTDAQDAQDAHDAHDAQHAEHSESDALAAAS